MTILLHETLSMVRKEILGKVERKVLEAYLLGERLKTYNVLLARIRNIGLKEIIEGCEYDLHLLRTLLKKETLRARLAESS